MKFVSKTSVFSPMKSSLLTVFRGERVVLAIFMRVQAYSDLCHQHLAEEISHSAGTM